MDYLILLGYFMSYLFPIIAIFVWAKFLKGKHQVAVGIANLVYAIISLIVPLVKFEYIEQYLFLDDKIRAQFDVYLAYPLVSFLVLLIIMNVTFGVMCVLARLAGEIDFLYQNPLRYLTEGVKGVPLWRSFLSRLVGMVGHPLVVYPVIIVASAFFDLHLFEYIHYCLRNLLDYHFLW